MTRSLFYSFRGLPSIRSMPNHIVRASERHPPHSFSRHRNSLSREWWRVIWRSPSDNWTPNAECSQLPKHPRRYAESTERRNSRSSQSSHGLFSVTGAKSVKPPSPFDVLGAGSGGLQVQPSALSMESDNLHISTMTKRCRRHSQPYNPTTQRVDHRTSRRV